MTPKPKQSYCSTKRKPVIIPLFARIVLFMEAEDKVGLVDFKLLSVIGSGPNSTVFLVENEFERVQYALKKVSLNLIRQSQTDDLWKSVEDEIRNYQQAPFFTNLNSVFIDGNHIYFIGNFCLYSLLPKASLNRLISGLLEWLRCFSSD